MWIGFFEIKIAQYVWRSFFFPSYLYITLQTDRVNLHAFVSLDYDFWLFRHFLFSAFFPKFFSVILPQFGGF